MSAATSQLLCWDILHTRCSDSDETGWMDGLVKAETDRRKLLLTYLGELLRSEDHLHRFIAEVEKQNLFFPPPWLKEDEEDVEDEDEDEEKEEEEASLETIPLPHTATWNQQPSAGQKAALPAL